MGWVSLPSTNLTIVLHIFIFLFQFLTIFIFTYFQFTPLSFQLYWGWVYGLWGKSSYLKRMTTKIMGSQPGLWPFSILQILGVCVSVEVIGLRTNFDGLTHRFWWAYGFVHSGIRPITLFPFAEISGLIFNRRKLLLALKKWTNPNSFTTAQTNLAQTNLFRSVFKRIYFFFFYMSLSNWLSFAIWQTYSWVSVYFFFHRE